MSKTCLLCKLPIEEETFFYEGGVRVWDTEYKYRIEKPKGYTHKGCGVAFILKQNADKSGFPVKVLSGGEWKTIYEPQRT